MKRQKYHIGIRILHWLMAIIILGLLGLGWYMTTYGESLPNRGDLYALHKSFGVTILVLIVFRIIIRLDTKAPPLPLGINVYIRYFARFTQFFLYILMIAVPLSGIAMSNYFGYDVKWFGRTLPKLFPTEKSLGELFKELHGIIAYGLLGLVILHIAGAIKHKFFDKKENDILPTML